MIKIDHLFKTFESKDKKVQACKDVTLSIKRGEIFGIMGTSGAGKSTLVRCLNFLEKPDQGSIEIDGFGQVVAENGTLILKQNDKCGVLKEKNLQSLRQKTGMIFQHFNLFDRRTVAENIAYPLKGKSRKEIEERVDELLNLVHLSDKKKAYPAELSGGQKQRAAIARALANDPNILLCDEATSALDPQATTAVLSLLKELNTRLGLTIILITHEMDVIKRIADRAAVMGNGAVIECGKVYDLFVHPKHDLTRTFVYGSSHEETKNIIAEPSSKGVRIRLNFDERSLSQPVLFQMIQSLGVEVNILAADINRIGNQPYGTLLFETQANPNQLTALKQFLNDKHVETEVIEYV
ncbi:MAG: ATP-binding cassette domain-containing protein [Allobaculum sp.]|nr:ATP-binding cassette domain-containing protein [Allobaculum sp.]